MSRVIGEFVGNGRSEFFYAQKKRRLPSDSLRDVYGKIGKIREFLLISSWRACSRMRKQRQRLLR